MSVEFSMLQNSAKDQISVVMATYNGAAYIREQLDSILAQSVEPAEIIIVDDGSTDATIEIIRGYSSPLIAVYPNPSNMGVQRSFGIGIDHARHDLVALCDQDDVWEADKLEKLSGILGDRDLAFSDAVLVDEDGDPLGQNLSDRVPGYGKELTRHDLKFMLFNSHIWGSTVLVRRDLYSRYSPIPMTYRNHDWWLQISAAFGGGMAYVNEPLTRRRIHSQNYSVAKKAAAFSKVIRRAWFRKSPTTMHDQGSLLSAVAESGLPLDGSQRQFLQEAIEAYVSGPSFKLAAFSLKYRNTIFWGRSAIKQVVLGLGRW